MSSSCACARVAATCRVEIGRSRGAVYVGMAIMWCDVVWCGEFWRASVSLCLCRLSEGPWVWRMDAWHGMACLEKAGAGRKTRRDSRSRKIRLPLNIFFYPTGPLPSTHLFSTAHENFYHLELLLIILYSLHLVFTSSQLTSSYQYLRKLFDSMTVNSSASSHIVYSHRSERRRKKSSFMSRCLQRTCSEVSCDRTLQGCTSRAALDIVVLPTVCYTIT